MDALRRQVRLARVRLWWQSFLGKLGWCWFATLFAAVLAVVAARFWQLADVRTVAVISIGVALAVGLVAAVAWSWLTRQDPLYVAAEIDRRFGLKERVSSTLSLGQAELDSEIGQLLARDAASRAQKIDVPVQFPVRLDWRSLLPLLPAGIALGLTMFLGEQTVKPTAAAAVNPAETAQIKKSTEATAKKLEEIRKAAVESGMDEALLAELIKGTKEAGDAAQTDRKKALMALNDLAKDAEKRRQQLSGANDLKQQLNQLKLQQGPAQKLASAMKNGDLKKAIDELEQLKEKIAGDKLSATEKMELARQIEQMQKALEKTAEAHQQAKEELKQRIGEEQRKGNTAEAAKIQQQLDRLEEKSKQMERMSQMAMQLKQAGEQMKNGDKEKAADALGKLSSELAGMQAEMDELAMLDDALEQLGDCKNGMNCKECDGEGCQACQGEGGKFSEKWMRGDWGRGRGVGAGKRDKKETDADFIDSQVQQNVGRGQMVIKGFADGPNRKGAVQELIKSEFDAGVQQEADVLSDQRLPHDYRDHAKGYFEALREGQR